MDDPLEACSTSLDEALERVLQDRVKPAEKAANEFKSVMLPFVNNLLGRLRNEPYFGALLNTRCEPTELRETGRDRFEVQIPLKNLWRLVGLHLEIRLGDGDGTVLILPRRAADIESKMVLARVQHPLFDVIRPSDVIVLFAAAVSAAVPKMKFSHKAMQGRPRVLMSNATVTLFVDFNGSPMRLELMPVFQFPWSFLPDELKESRNLKLHQAKTLQTESIFWMTVPQTDRHKLTWAVEFQSLEKAFCEANNTKDAMRLIQGILKSVDLDLPNRVVLQAMLWLDEERGSDFWNSGLSNVIVEVIEFLQQALCHSKLTNFWIDGHELLGTDTQAASERLVEVLTMLRSPNAAEAVMALVK